jgi:Fur family peroxide stress response transcriptional regulator
MKKENLQEQFDLFVKKCRDHDLKVTPQRSAIYRELMGLDTHPTADEIFQKVKNDFPHISFDTVNRTLMTFSQIGLIEPVEGYGRSRRFDARVDGHHHVHCIRCQKIIDFHSNTYDKLEIPKEIERKFTVLSKKVVINAICETCRKEINYE